MLGTSDAWSKSHLSKRTSEPAYYNVDCLISDVSNWSKKRPPGIRTEQTYFFLLEKGPNSQKLMKN